MSLSPHPRPTVAVDLAILTLADGHLCVLLANRPDAAVVGGDWALPGGFVHQGQPLTAAVERVLNDKARLRDVHFEQLATFGDPGRDPRGHVISVTYLALCPPGSLPQPDGRDTCLARLVVDWPGEKGGPARALGPDRQPLHLAFDHRAILGEVVRRLRGKINYSDLAFALLPPRFTLRALQEVHEAVLGRRLTKPAFRRRMLDTGRLRATGDYETGGAFRPAELYKTA
ncbi:MAG: NUDIX hydrolase [Tabrizicola sp.]|nr:NUDIX hydrolase [Tabrizicola sp.]